MIIVAKLNAKTLDVVHLVSDSKHQFVCSACINSELVTRLRDASGSRIALTLCKTELFEKDLDELDAMQVPADGCVEARPGLYVLGSSCTNVQPFIASFA